ncbi:hypothetical protein OH76DRAFT_1476640 [Lentinus brumalis]|uniref:Uncharacterized protein n=1 Tax=Lentinus brumalis TaxID=2498619 RepID=A0A371DXC0_9APHY|nr:hypothetical protein OH76DRAFT_1476640 [Polyporus brumalis]
MAFIPPPPGLNYVAAIEPSLSLLLIGAVCSSILIPIGIALLFFSTSAQRKRPIFILNVISIAFGLIEGALNIYNQTCAILARPINTNVYIVDVLIFILIPIFSESILLLRVIAVYPPRLLPKLSRVAIYGPIALAAHQDSYASRLKALFWIAVSNFVLPVILTLVQLIYVFRDTNFFHGTIVFNVNTYVQIIGVLLATIWCTGTHKWYDGGDPRKVALPEDHGLSTFRCVSNPDAVHGSAKETTWGNPDDSIPIYDSIKRNTLP